MKNQKQNVWVGTETLKNDPAFLELAEKEFVDDVKRYAGGRQFFGG